MTSMWFFMLQGATFVLLMVLGLIAYRAGDMQRNTRRDIMWVTLALEETMKQPESPEEADKARLDWLEENRPSIIEWGGERWIINGHKSIEKLSGKTFREAIDQARKAPQPTDGRREKHETI